MCRTVVSLSLSDLTLKPWSFTENLYQAVRDYLVLTILQLPNGKSESIRIVWTPVMLSAILGTCRRVGITSSHTTGTSAQAADAKRPGVGEFLHYFRTGDLQPGGIDLPAVARRNIPECLRVELAWQRSHTEFLHGIGNHLGALVVHLQGGIEVFIDEQFQRLEQSENKLPSPTSATADAIFLRTHVQQGIPN